MELQPSNSDIHQEPSNEILQISSQLESWNYECDKIRQQLDGLIQDSEKTFLDMGNRFLHYSEQSKAISKSSQSATTLFFSDTVMKAIEELYELLDRIRRYLQYNETELSNNSEILRNILKTIQTIHHPFDQFEKLVRKLRFLGISTRIESSRLKNTDKSFETLSQDVKNLSNKIDSKLNSIIEGSSALRNTISQTLSQSINLKSQQYKQAKQILKNTHNCLQALIDTHEKSSVTAQSLADQAKTIERHISKIVESIQFQDIIRQKVEHIIQAVDDIKNLMTRGLNATADEIIEINDISELQVDQLKVAEQEILTAINNLVSGLNGIAQNLERMITDTQGILADSEAEKGNRMDRIESNISTVTQLLRDNASANYDLNLAMQESSNMVDNMATFVADIHQIGYQIELIALNGIVNAAHIGSEGAALSVLADAIQRLSVDAQEHIKAVSSILTDIIALADKLSVGLTSDTDVNNLEVIVNEMVNDLSTLLSSIRVVHDEVDGYMQDVTDNGTSITKDINRFSKSIRIQNKFSDVFQTSANTLISISEKIYKIVSQPDSASKSERLTKLLDRYTMHSERAIHEGLAVGEISEECAAEDEHRDELDDNIELF